MKLIGTKSPQLWAENPRIFYVGATAKRAKIISPYPQDAREIFLHNNLL